MPIAQLSDPTLQAFVQQVYKHTGVTMDESKRTMLMGRLSRRARKLNIPCLDDYLKLVKRDPKEQAAFVDVVTTHKTSMFRSARVWQYIRDEWLHEYRPAHNGPIRGWSAACSTGSEAASLALVFHDHANKTERFRWRVDASDVSENMVQTATAQQYTAEQLSSAASRAPGLDPRHGCEPMGRGAYQLQPQIRQNMSFYQHNLFHSPPSGPFDLILVRNVLIYFSKADKDRVVKTLLGSLRPGGLLVVGESETLEHGRLGLEFLEHCVYRRPSPQ